MDIIPLSELRLHTHNKKCIFSYNHESYTVLRQWQSEIQSLPHDALMVHPLVLGVICPEHSFVEIPLHINLLEKKYFRRDQNKSNITIYY